MEQIIDQPDATFSEEDSPDEVDQISSLVAPEVDVPEVDINSTPQRYSSFNEIDIECILQMSASADQNSSIRDAVMNEVSHQAVADRRLETILEISKDELGD